jgi:hypothetical protein
LRSPSFARLLSALPTPASEIATSGKVLGFCFALAAVAGLFAGMVKKLTLRDSLIAAGVSGVGGLVVGALCVYFWGPDKWYLTCAACSLAGWAGGNLVLDRLTFVAWTIARGKLPTIGNPPEQKEARHEPDPVRTVDPLADLDELDAGLRTGGDRRRV